MPEVHKGSGANNEAAERKILCKRCGERDALYVVRLDGTCQDCFIRFVKTKVIKRMEAFRGQQQDQKRSRKYLLPLSLGASSISLLHILDDHSEGQIGRSGRANYELHCLHVYEQSLSSNESLIVERLKSRYPRHEYTVQPMKSASDVVAFQKPSSSSTSDMASELLVDEGETNQTILHNIMSSLSSRADMVQIMRAKSIVETSQQLGCDGILWGDTTTRLAEKVLAETAKGRGSSLPWLVNDGQTPDGTTFLYPLKDVLKKEILQFARCSSMSENILSDEWSINSAPTPIKNSTIDSLMTEYFRSVEENYPSIVANVVRTSSKLQTNESDNALGSCALCGLPSDQLQAMDSAAKDGPDNNSKSMDNGIESRLCYGCNRLMRGDNGRGH